MTTGGNTHELAGWAARRYASHALLLAAVTAGGLWLLGGSGGAPLWVGFAVASALAVAVPKRWLRRGASGEPSDADAVDLDGSAPPKPLDEPRRSERPGSAAPADDADYLRALRHEFRTPLNAVLGFADVLLSGIDGEINESQREDLEIIRASGIRLRILLDSALDVSQLVDGTLRLDVERVDLPDLVRRAAGEAGQLWSAKSAPECRLPNAPCTADADEARLRRSVVILADFLATTHRGAEVAIALAPSRDYFTIEVTAEPADRPSIDALPTTAEVLASEDMLKIRQWPVAVTSELIGRHGGSLYHGTDPARFRIRIPFGGDVG